MPMQPQKPPRGQAMELAKAIARTIDRENRKRKGRISVKSVLRALEWSRYTVTEAVVKVTGGSIAV